MYYQSLAKSKAPAATVAFCQEPCQAERMPTVTLVVMTTKQLAPLASEALFRAGAQGLEERAGRGVELVAYGEDRASLAAIWKRAKRALLAGLPATDVPDARIEVDADERWKTDWTAYLRPVALTPRLWLAPSTHAPPKLRRGQELIVYQPALAFGDGDHPTTRLAARAIEAHYRRAPEGTGALLDIGTGTGVLSFVALASGAARALGSDVDPQALEAARVNAKLNRLGKRARFVAAGARISGKFDLAVINIELRPLLLVLAQLPPAARRTPRLLVTGILDQQSAAVTAALEGAGFAARQRARASGWVLLEARPR